nr:IclR family transcriptional regulator [Alicyclobacillus sp. SO9]
MARGLMVLNCFQAQRTPGSEGDSRDGATGLDSNSGLDSAPGKDIELGIKDLSTQLSLPPTVVSRLTATLVEYGYLYQNPATRKYRLGLTAFTLGLSANPQLELNQASRPWMQQLAKDTRETISLTVIDPASHNGICISSLDSPSQIKLTTTVGSIRPLHRGATRKVLLAFMQPENSENYIERLKLPKDEEDGLAAELKSIRDQGFAYSEEELDEGAFAVAAPILGGANLLLGGISILAPVFRHDNDDIRRFSELVQTAAEEIGRAIRR